MVNIQRSLPELAPLSVLPKVPERAGSSCLSCENPVNAGVSGWHTAVAGAYNPAVSKQGLFLANHGVRHLNAQQTIRLAVIDDDSGFVTVLSKRTETAGWQQRVMSSAIPPDELVAMKLNALLRRPHRSRRRSVGLPGAGLRDAARPRRGRLHRPLDRGPAGAGPAARSRRLDRQALPPGGGDGADRGRLPPPTPQSPRRRRRPSRCRRAGDPRRPVPGLRRRRQPRPDPPRVRAAAAARRRQGPGARARGDLPAGLGLRDGPRRSLGRRLHPQAAPEAGEALAGLALHPHPLRRRLPLRSRGVPRLRQRTPSPRRRPRLRIHN